MPAQGISLTSLGLVVLDEIRFPNRDPLTNVLGGSGAYGWFLIIVCHQIGVHAHGIDIVLFIATLGARLFLPAPSSHSVGWMLHIGNDFPATTLDFIASWNTRLIVDKELEKPSTRGLLEYKDTTFGRA